jgi:MFS family permease
MSPDRPDLISSWSRLAAAGRRTSPRSHRGPAADSGAGTFRRDPPTRLCYAALAAYAFWLYAFGPAFALLRAELHFSYTLLGVYSAMWSVGAALVGVSFAGLARRLSRAALLWCSAAAATAGTGLFTAAHTVPLTLLGDALTGFAGTTLLTCVQAILSDRHGERRDRALTEANVGAAACAVLTPLLLGLLQGTAAGWRAAMGLPVLVLAGLYLRYRHQPLAPAPAGWSAKSAGRLPLSCWLLAAMVAVGIAVEFCVVYFGAESLAATGLSTARAATAISGFYLGILAGRVAVAWLTRSAGRSVPLLWASLAVTAAGFLLFWLATVPALAITGLFVCGLGVASLYPLSLAITLAAAPRAASSSPGHPGQDSDRANAAVQLLGGALVIVAPFLLGSLADHIGLHAAFAIDLVLIGIAALLLLIGLKAARHTAAPADHARGLSRRRHVKMLGNSSLRCLKDGQPPSSHPMAADLLWTQHMPIWEYDGHGQIPHNVGCLQCGGRGPPPRNPGRAARRREGGRGDRQRPLDVPAPGLKTSAGAQ